MRDLHSTTDNPAAFCFSQHLFPDGFLRFQMSRFNPGAWRQLCTQPSVHHTLVCQVALRLQLRRSGLQPPAPSPSSPCITRTEPLSRRRFNLAVTAILDAGFVGRFFANAAEARQGDVIGTSGLLTGTAEVEPLMAEAKKVA